MDEFHHGSQVEVLFATVAERTASQQEEGGSEPFATGGDDVACHLADQWNPGVQPAGDNLIKLTHILRDD
jgi:hypothetical protein